VVALIQDLTFAVCLEVLMGFLTGCGACSVRLALARIEANDNHSPVRHAFCISPDSSAYFEFCLSAGLSAPAAIVLFNASNLTVLPQPLVQTCF